MRYDAEPTTTTQGRGWRKDHWSKMLECRAWQRVSQALIRQVRCAMFVLRPVNHLENPKLFPFGVGLDARRHTIYMFDGERSEIACYSSRDGRMLRAVSIPWEHKCGEIPSSVSVVPRGRNQQPDFVVSALTHPEVCVFQADGTAKCRFRTDGEYQTVSKACRMGIIVINGDTRHATLYSFDGTPRVRWRYVWPAMCLAVADHEVLLGSDYGVEAFRLPDGAPLYRWAASLDVVLGGMAVRDHVIFLIHDLRHTVSAYRKCDGALLHVLQCWTEAQAPSYLAVSLETGLLVVCEEDGSKLDVWAVN